MKKVLFATVAALSLISSAAVAEPDVVRLGPITKVKLARVGTDRGAPSGYQEVRLAAGFRDGVLPGDKGYLVRDNDIDDKGKDVTGQKIPGSDFMLVGLREDGTAYGYAPLGSTSVNTSIAVATFFSMTKKSCSLPVPRELTQADAASVYSGRPPQGYAVFSMPSNIPTWGRVVVNGTGTNAKVFPGARAYVVGMGMAPTPARIFGVTQDTMTLDARKAEEAVNPLLKRNLKIAVAVGSCG
jgi:hypothetical protein